MLYLTKQYVARLVHAHTDDNYFRRSDSDYNATTQRVVEVFWACNYLGSSWTATHLHVTPTDSLIAI